MALRTKLLPQRGRALAAHYVAVMLVSRVCSLERKPTCDDARSPPSVEFARYALKIFNIPRRGDSILGHSGITAASFCRYQYFYALNRASGRGHRLLLRRDYFEWVL